MSPGNNGRPAFRRAGAEPLVGLAVQLHQVCFAGAVTASCAYSLSTSRDIEVCTHTGP